MSNKIKLLVVEDVLPLANLIKQSLIRKGCVVFIACTLEQSKRVIQDNEDIAAVWLDHYLVGGGSGYDFLLFLKSKDSKYKDVPVFLVSNSVTQEKIEEYKMGGIDNYYVKSKHHLDEISEDIIKRLSSNRKSL